MVDQRRIDNQRLVDARTAAKHLGIQVRSLYAYVSRGQVKSVPGERGRPRLYSLDDLERLRVRRDARAGHGAVAAGALRWGEPVLDSAITAITPRGPAYRGHLAVELAAREAPFENVAELLWSGYLPERRIAWGRREPWPLAQLAHVVVPGLSALDAMPLFIHIAAAADRELVDRNDADFTRGRTVIPFLAAALAFSGRTPVTSSARSGVAMAAFSRALGASTVAGIATRALGLDDEVTPLLERVLVVLADHELNASSFAARIAASTGAGPDACVAAALATLSGPKHGTASADVARFADEVGSPDAARAAVRALARKQLTPPGFGHTLYPHGDPRARPLLDAVATLPGTKRSRTLLAIVQAAKGIHPNVDVGLAAFVAALGLPPAAGAGLFAVARSAGWLAHAVEQRAAGYLLRPRARYVGVPVQIP